MIARPVSAIKRNKAMAPKVQAAKAVSSATNGIDFCWKLLSNHRSLQLIG